MKKSWRSFKYYAIIFSFIILIINGCRKDEDNPVVVKDTDGNEYHTVTIGTQVWLVENLKTTHYLNGDAITNVTNDTSVWNNLTTGAYSDYENIPANSLTFGRLYNWYAVNDSRNIAPVGWHIATEQDWNTLANYLGTDSISGGKLKEKGVIHWNSPNTGATNIFGFTALPAGIRLSNGTFDLINKMGFWWTSTEFNSDYSFNRDISSDAADLFSSTNSKNCGFSVRCVKD